MPSWWKRLTGVLIRYRVRLTFALVLGLGAWEAWRGLSLRPVLSPGDPVGLAGSLLVVLGALLRSWSAGVIHKTRALATTGPYALFRHPLYLGSLAIAVGLLIIVNEPVNLVALALLGALVYVPKIRAEERHLAALFGEQWAAYRRRTGFFFPRRRPGSLRMEWRLEQWRHNREYRGLLTSLAALALLGWLG